MIKYRISKYDPEFRNVDGVYMNDEWTSISDVGKVYNGQIFTMEKYAEIEKNYLRFLESMLGSDKYMILKLECSNIDNLIDIGLFQSQSKLDNKKKIRLPKSITGMTISQVISFIRQCLQEKCWGKVKGDNKVIYVGYEYYLHIDSKKEIPNIQEIAKTHCLFVEHLS